MPVGRNQRPGGDRDASLRVARALIPVLLAGASSASGQPASYEIERERFAAEMGEKYGFDVASVGALLGRATYRQAVVDAMERPYEAKSWHRYRRLFLTPERISGGVAFWRQNAEILSRCQEIYRVPAELIVAILGIETSYGARVGDHRAIDALTTLGFSYPKRATFFRGELEQLLLLGREGQLDALAALGSYAGALGQPQFIPSSYRNYAVDFDGDGKRDLWASNADVVGSVGNYLSRHGWVPDGPVAFRATVPTVLTPELGVAEKTPVAPNLTADQLRSLGVEWQGMVDGQTRTTLVRLDGARDEYWVTFANFYVITRYNQSNLYAMAAYHLGQAIKDQYGAALDRGALGPREPAPGRP
jgi:peptidoglycan lytic transglycosylase B